jgi:hypothetical protein
LRAETADRKYVKVNEEQKEIVLSAQSVSRIRALLNSVLYSAYAVTQTIKEVEQLGREPST